MYLLHINTIMGIYYKQPYAYFPNELEKNLWKTWAYHYEHKKK